MTAATPYRTGDTGWVASEDGPCGSPVRVVAVGIGHKRLLVAVPDGRQGWIDVQEFAPDLTRVEQHKP